MPIFEERKPCLNYPSFRNGQGRNATLRRQVREGETHSVYWNIFGKVTKILNLIINNCDMPEYTNKCMSIYTLQYDCWCERTTFYKLRRNVHDAYCSG